MAKKKWKKRLKKIAKAALIGGALYAGAKALKGSKGNVSKTAANENANIGVTHSALKTPYITKKVPKSKPVDDSWLDVPKGAHGAGGKGDYWRRQKALALTAGNKVPPSMRGGLEHAEGYQRKIPARQHYPGGWEGGYSMRAKGGRIGAKKGGSVTGAAKRGFGRALMKGKK